MKIPAAKIVIPEEDRKDILAKIEESLTSGQLTLGKNGREFEEKFADYHRVKYAISVNSGTSAIEIPLRIVDVKDKEVIVPTNTFFATALAVIHAGAKVRFVDIDPNTFSLDIEDLQKKLNKRTKVVVIVHIAGIINPRIREIQQFCKEKDLFLFEDAAHAHGCAFDNQMAGTFGTSGSFSFYPTKVMTAVEGGMITTNSDELNAQARLYRDQGKATFNSNIHNKLGYNWRMSELHAIVGLKQLNRLDQFIQERNKIALIYNRELKSERDMRILEICAQNRCNYYKYIVLLKKEIDRTALKNMLRQDYDINLSGEVYELPCHLQPYFNGLYKKGDFPNSEDICAKHICLPIYAGMHEEEALYVTFCLKEAIQKLKRSKK